MNSRALAARIIDRTLEQGGMSHELLREAFRNSPDMDSRERNFITALVHGTISRALTLDYYLDRVSRVPTAQMKPYLRSVLRMGLYQILYMDRVPDAAAVNESVKLVRKQFGPGLTGFANGVLRAAAREKDRKEPEGAAAYSLPQPLYDYLTGLYGEEKARQTAEYYLSAPQLWCRVNLSRLSRDEAAAMLARDGWQTRPHPASPAALALEREKAAASPEPGKNGPDVPLERTEAVRRGFVQLQDISAQLAVSAAAPQPGMRVLDLCAAPGGKSLQAADLMRNEGEVTACDLTEVKCRLIRENAERSGFSCLRVRQADATVFEPSFEKTYDLVIADLPCSGLGTASRKPEIKYRVTRTQVTDLAALQRRILNNAVRYVKPGGKILYSTCTLTKEENTDNALYIEQELGLRPSPLPQAGRQMPGTDPDSPHLLQLLPGDLGGDGFFISLFAKETT